MSESSEEDQAQLFAAAAELRDSTAAALAAAAQTLKLAEAQLQWLAEQASLDDEMREKLKRYTDEVAEWISSTRETVFKQTDAAFIVLRAVDLENPEHAGFLYAVAEAMQAAATQSRGLAEGARLLAEIRQRVQGGDSADRA